MNYVRKFESAQKHRAASEIYLAIVNDKVCRHLGETLQVVHTRGDGWCVVHSPGDRTTPINTQDLHHLLNLKQEAALCWLQERMI